MVSDAAGFLKKQIDAKLKNVYICSSEQIAIKSPSGNYYVSPLINSTSNFEDLTLAESVLNDKGEPCIIFLSDTTYIPDLSCPDGIKRISLHDVVETIFHEIMHVILRGRVDDWFYIALEENGKLPSLEKSIKTFYKFINDKKMHSNFLSYIEELCQVNNLFFNDDNINKIKLSSLFKANVMLGNADCLALYLRDIADFAARTNVEKIFGRNFQAALRAEMPPFP